jgi:deoxyribodipyrimidine photolyase-like uncharacterized protein
MHNEMIGGHEYVIGDYNINVDDMPVRVRVFCDDLVRPNPCKKKKTSEEYLTKMACHLVFRCMYCSDNIYEELVEQILGSALDSGYTLCYYRTRLYMFYCMKMLELGHKPEDPYKYYPEREFKGMYQWTETDESVNAHYYAKEGIKAAKAAIEAAKYVG